MFPKICAGLWRCCWTLILNLAALILLGKGVWDMAVVYAILIIKGKKNFADTPEVIKGQVKEILVALDCAELAE